MNHLEGKHVALTASRKTGDMQTLLHKQGATSEVRSMQGTVKQNKEAITRFMQKDLAGDIGWFIFTTGIGVTTLMEYADEAGLKGLFLEKMRSAHIAARGYKTVAALKKLGISVDIRSDDGTTAGLQQQLKDAYFSGKHVIIQQYGVSSPMLEEYLEEQGAAISTWLPYVHDAPDGATVDHFIQELIEQKYDAVCFTTGLQVKSLFGRASEAGKHGQLAKVFEGKTIATAVGKVTAEALKEEGISRVVSPTTERMGAMIVELGRYVSGAV